MASVQVIEGIEGSDAVVHGLEVFGSRLDGFSAEEAYLFFWGELVGHWGTVRSWLTLGSIR